MSQDYSREVTEGGRQVGASSVAEHIADDLDSTCLDKCWPDGVGCFNVF